MDVLSSSSSTPHDTQLRSVSVSPLNNCSHPKAYNGVCLSCAQTMDEGYGLSFTYIVDGLKISQQEVSRLKKSNSEMLFRQKKLHLVLDLDHTLLHAINLDMLDSGDKHLIKLASCSKESSDSDLFKMASGFLVKLRPYIRNFLKEASTMYDIYICTMGTRPYAEIIAELLDPKCEYYISSRLITREDFKERGRKDLDLVLGQERGIVIVDDTEQVWEHHKENLMLVGKYDYFKEGRRQNRKSYSERKTDEEELNGGALVNVLRVLKTVHGLFFENPENLVCGDVRGFLGNIRRRILAGCTLFFSDDVEEFEFPLVRWRAEELGAACADVYVSPVTHVVSARQGSEGFLLGEQQNKFLVHPRWIYAAYYLWSRQAEKNYFPL